MTTDIPYYSPHLTLTRVIKAIFVRNAEELCMNYFREYTGKKYILLTNSCRTALYLTYKALGQGKKVIASPLICKTALEPILKSNNEIEFVDVDMNTFNIDINKLPQKISDDVLGIQVTYLGGTPADMNKLVEYASKNNIYLIEDCAQGFGSRFNNNNLGTFGDVACYSLIKTAYGISGGVLATNNKALYDEVLNIYTELKKPNLILDIYRLFRSTIDTYRYKSAFFKKLYQTLQNARPNKIKNKDSLVLTKPTTLSMKVFASIIPILTDIHNKRYTVAKDIVSALDETFKTNINVPHTIPTKLFIYSKDISSISDISTMRGNGIQTMHLQQKYDSIYQDSINDPVWRSVKNILNQYPIFAELHDHMISVPLLENMTKNDIQYIVQQINKCNNEKENLV